MKLIVNGEKRNFDGRTVSELLRRLDLNKDIVAVEMNKNIVHRENFDSTTLSDNDKIEIVKVVGGG